MIKLLIQENMKPYYQGIVDPSANFQPGMIAEHKVFVIKLLKTDTKK